MRIPRRHPTAPRAQRLTGVEQSDRLPTQEAGHSGRRGWRRGVRKTASWLWALMPVLPVATPLGPATPFVIAAIWRRSKSLSLAAAGYVAATTTAFVIHSAMPGHDAIVGLILWPVFLGGFVHALLIRRRVFELPSRPPIRELPAESVYPRPQRALTEALRARALRQEARELLASDPALAEELGIGRPDLYREFDDGGLVDVNHASAAAITGCLPGLTEQQAAQIISVREQLGGFSSLADLEVHTDVPAGLLDRHGERLIFLPRDA